MAVPEVPVLAMPKLASTSVGGVDLILLGKQSRGIEMQNKKELLAALLKICLRTLTEEEPNWTFLNERLK